MYDLDVEILWYVFEIDQFRKVPLQRIAREGIYFIFHGSRVLEINERLCHNCAVGKCGHCDADRYAGVM